MTDFSIVEARSIQPISLAKINYHKTAHVNQDLQLFLSETISRDFRLTACTNYHLISVQQNIHPIKFQKGIYHKAGEREIILAVIMRIM